MCSIDDAEDWQFGNIEQRRARKPHRCIECGREIAAGELYQYARGYFYDGGWCTYRSCLNCDAARTWLVVQCGGSLFHGLGEELQEHWDYSTEYRSVWLARAIVGMRRKWRTRRGALMEPLPNYVRKEAA
jgi:hypothetical protein